MAKGWQKGQSGNPNGRPPKKRQLTEILERAGNAKSPNGVAAKKQLADMLWQAVLTGRVIFDDGTIMALKTEDWIAVNKFIYQQIDGPPKPEIEISGPNGGPIGHKVEHSLDSDTAASIFDILAAAGAIAPAADDAQDDGVHPT